MVDLIGKRNYFFAISILIIIAGIIFWFANGGMNGGFKMDIQFEGGTILQLQMNDSNYDTDKVVKIVKDTVNKEASVQKSQTLNAKDTTKKIDLLQVNIASKEALSGDEMNKLIDTLRKEFNIPADASIDVSNVAPLIGNEIKVNGLKAVFWSALLIILYIWFRFQVMSGLSAGVFAVLALLHDILIMLAVYLFFRIPLNESFIAAALTVIGYSMNDTIIIYDRIRENSNLLRKIPIGELVNKSIIQTLARSINTVVTVLICIIATYIFAYYHNIQSMKEFTLPLIIGIASGCYSSIFIASPLWVVWKEAQAKKRLSAKPAKA